MQETWVQSLGQEDALEEGMAAPLQYSCLENPMDRGTCWAMIYRVTRNWTQLKQFSTHILKLQRIKSKQVTFLARNVKRPLKRGEVKVMQACLTLYNPMDCIVHGILQARILEWVAFPFPKGSSQPRDQTQASHIAGGFFTS